VDAKDSLIGALYEAAINPSLWPSALAQFADFMGSAEACFLVGAINTEVLSTFQVQRSVFSGRVMGPPEQKAHFEHYSKVDIRAPRRMQLPVGYLALCHELVAQEEVNRSEIYQDFLVPLGLRYNAGWLLELSQDRVITLGLGAKTPFDREQIKGKADIVLHASHAIQLMARLAKRLETRDLFRAAVDHQRLACLMVDSKARLLDSSAAAIALLETGKWLNVRPEGRLVGTSAVDTARLRDLAKRTAHGEGGGSMRIRNELGAECLIEAIPAGLRAENPFYPPRASCVLLFLTVLARAGRELAGWIDAGKIQILLKCTQAEAEVAASLLAGLTPARIAQDREVSLNTVRTQIRALLEVSGTRRVPELIVLLARSL
jgi:DNA-binding CsgD family transcriptional regulator